jgi:hypothetical protein
MGEFILGAIVGAGILALWLIFTAVIIISAAARFVGAGILAVGELIVVLLIRLHERSLK